MRRQRLMGIDPHALDGAIQERRERHRPLLDQLRARLSAAEGRLAQLRAQQAELATHLGRRNEEGERLLQELNQLGEESDRPRQVLLERHSQAEAGLREAVQLLENELANWAGLERQVAEGVMQAVQPYLDLNAMRPYLDTTAPPPPEPLPEPPELAGAFAALRQALAQAAPARETAPAPPGWKEDPSHG